MNHQNIGKQTLKIPFVDLKREANFFFKELISDTEKILKSGMYINGESVNKFENSVKARKEHKFQCETNNISLNNNNDNTNMINKLLEIKKLLDEGVITNKEFTKMKKKIIN